MYKKFSDFVVFDPPDVTDYIVGYRELGGEFRTTLGNITDIVKKFSYTSLTNTVFVNLSGSDSEVGTSESVAFRTIKRAVAKALEISRNLTTESLEYERENGWGTNPVPVTVFVRAGDYVEDNPIYVPPGVTIVGENSRSVNFIPKNKFYDGFWVNNKTSIQGLNFKDFLEPAYSIAYPEFRILNNKILNSYPNARINDATSKAYYNYNIDPNKYPSTKESKTNFLNFASDGGSPIFDPFKIAFLGRYYRDLIGNEIFYTLDEYLLQKEFWETNYYNLSTSVQRPYIINAPYIQKIYSTNTSTSLSINDAGGTIFIDGYNVDGPLRTIIVDSCEHFNQGGKGVHITNDGHAFIINDSSTSCYQSVLVDNGGSCNINGANYSFGLSGLVAIGKSSKPTMLGTLKNPIYSNIETKIITVTNLGSPLLSSLQVFPNDKKPYVGQVFQIIDATYSEVTTTGINYLSAQNSETLFVVQSASNLRPASSPDAGYECDIVIEGVYSLPNDSTINTKTFLPPIVDKLNVGSNVLFYSQSKIVASSQMFNYIGTGTNYVSGVPQNGALANSDNEIKHDKIGRILCDSSNESGTKKLGDYIKFDQTFGIVSSNTVNTKVLSALSAFIDVLDIKQYEVSGFNVKGDLDVLGNLNVNKNSNLTGNLTLYGNLSSFGTQTIDVNQNTPALKITQKGTGDCVLIEDENNYDLTPFVIDNSGNVGIGTRHPNQKLTVVGEISATDKLNVGNRIFLDRDNANHSWLGAQGDLQDSSRVALGFQSSINGLIEHLDFYTNSTSRLHVTSAGNVGIGTDFPNENLTVVGNVSATGAYFGDGSKLTGITDTFYNKFLPLTGGELTGSLSLSTNSYDASLKIKQIGAGHSFLIENASNVFNSNFVVTNNGIVGIGTILPTEKLTINGSLTSNSLLYDAIGNSSEWNSGYYWAKSVYTTVLSWSAFWDDRAPIDKRRWDAVYVTVSALSGSWNSTYETVSALSAAWEASTKSTFTQDLTVSLGSSKTFGKYVNGDIIPAIGKKPEDIIKMAIVEALNPIVSLTSPTTILFNQTSIDNILNFNHTILSLGAVLQSASLEWRRNNTGSWTVLSTSSNPSDSYTHTLTDSDFNTEPFNYRYIVTDTSGGTSTALLNITPVSYVSPTISAPTIIAANGITSPETNTNRERGNVNSDLTGSITRNSINVPLVSYVLQYQINGTGGTWIDIGSPIAIAGNPPSYSIPSTNHNPTSTGNESVIYYRVKVIDAYQQHMSDAVYSGNSNVNFHYIIFYGPSASVPNTSGLVRALPSRIFTNGINPFNLITGIVDKTFTVAMPSTLSLTQVRDLDSLNAVITGNYNLNTFNVEDSSNSNVSYNVYTMVNAIPYTPPPANGHRHEITRG